MRWTIGKVARLAGVGVETVRFYEREGVIEKPPRRLSGYREYSSAAVSRIRFIKKAKQLGFSLKEVKELLDLRVDPSTTCGEVRSRANAKLEDIRQKIGELKRIEAALEKLVAACKGKGPIGECPILDALDNGGR